MTDMAAFERRVADAMVHRAGPMRPVDDLAVFESVAAASRSHRWGFTMLSTLKLVAASVILALASSFLFAGLPDMGPGEDILPAAMSASPAATASNAPSASPAAGVRTDILPGVELVVEDVEPGVFRILSDGVRELSKGKNFDIVAGHDGGIWLLRPNWFFRLGTGGAHKWPTETPRHADFEVDRDGTAWVQAQGRLQSFGGEGWTTHDGHWGLATAPDGTVWTTWWLEGEQPRQLFGFLQDDGWQPFGESAGFGEVGTFGWSVGDLYVAGADDIWGTVPTMVFGYLVRYVDGAWHRLVGIDGTEATWQPPSEPVLAEPAEGDSFGDLAVGPDGTVWLWGTDLVRIDGGEWRRWALPEGEALGTSPLEVAPDGSFWSASGVAPDDCRGLIHFDGRTWDHVLSDLCVGAIDITNDGVVWLLATRPGAGVLHVYAITPEALTAET